MAARISAVGLVTVSLRRSMTFMGGLRGHAGRHVWYSSQPSLPRLPARSNSDRLPGERDQSAMLAPLIAAAALAAASFVSPQAHAEDVITQGTLIWRDDSCFFFVLKT